MTEIPDEETKRQYMDDAIKAANSLRMELGRKVPGPLTVAPHVALLGGVVSVHMAHTQASHLAHIVHEHKPTDKPVRSEVDTVDIVVIVYRTTPKYLERDRKWRKFTRELSGKIYDLSYYDVRDFFSLRAHAYFTVAERHRLGELYNLLSKTGRHFSIEQRTVLSTHLIPPRGLRD